MADNSGDKRYFQNVISCDCGNDVLVWKHPVTNFNMGSQLIVRDSQNAIFVKNGHAVDCFEAGKYRLDAERLPLLGKIMELPTGGETPFQCEVYFVNRMVTKPMKWGTSNKIKMFDPATGLHLEIGGGGTFNMAVTDPKTLLVKLVGTKSTLTPEDLAGMENAGGYFRSLLIALVKSSLARTIRENNLNILALEEYLMEFSEMLKDAINEKLEDYGLAMDMFIVDRIVLPDDDPAFIEAQKLYGRELILVRKENILKAEAQAQAERRKVQENTEAELRAIRARGEAEAQRILSQAKADSYYMQASAESAEMKMKGYTYQDETNRQVSMEAMKNDGNGVTGVVGDMARLGASIGVVSGVSNMTRQAMNYDPHGYVPEQRANYGIQSPEPKTATSEGWKCSKCGTEGNTGKFCEECGAKRPEPASLWDCPKCGTKGNKGKFCAECGAKRPLPLEWDCTECGTRGNKGKFCSECGCKRPEV